MSDLISILKKIQEENKDKKVKVPLPFDIRFSEFANVDDVTVRVFNKPFDVYPNTIEIISDTHVKFTVSGNCSWPYEFKFDQDKQKWYSKNILFPNMGNIYCIEFRKPNLISILKNLQKEKEICKLPFKIKFLDSIEITDKNRKLFNEASFNIYPDTIKIISDTNVKFTVLDKVPWPYNFVFNSEKQLWVAGNDYVPQEGNIYYIEL